MVASGDAVREAAENEINSHIFQSNDELSKPRRLAGLFSLPR